MKALSFSAGEKDKEKRLDKYVAEVLLISRSQAQKIIAQGKVKISQQPAYASFRLRGEEEIVIEEYSPAELLPYACSIPIVYEDEEIIVVNKPPHLSTHPASLEQKDTLVNALLFMKRKLASNSRLRPGIVHRLDKETSGVMVVAKTLSAYSDLVKQFKARGVKKEYLALVEGRVKKGRFKISLPLARDNKNFRMKVGFLHSRPSFTEIEAKEVYDDASLVIARPLTGRTHQIRVHLSFFGHPIIGDVKYKGRKDSRLYLHAFRLEFLHPKTKKRLRFEAELPRQFKAKIKALKKHAAV